MTILSIIIISIPVVIAISDKVFHFDSCDFTTITVIVSATITITDTQT